MAAQAYPAMQPKLPRLQRALGALVAAGEHEFDMVLGR